MLGCIEGLMPSDGLLVHIEILIGFILYHSRSCSRLIIVQ